MKRRTLGAWSLAAGLIGLLFAVASCRQRPAGGPDPTAPGGSGGGHFTDVAEQVGLNFVHDAGRDGSYFMPEIMAAGGAVLDYDGDGDLDVYLINSGSHAATGATKEPSVNRLFRQDPQGRFTDVTKSSGLGHGGYGMGCAVGDIDNDGDADVYVTNFGPDVMFRNNGDGTFTDVTAQAGIAGDRWSCSAAFLDYDGDGHLDLYVTSYLHYSPPKACADFVGRPDYCGPETFSGVPDVLYRNRGQGRFTDVTTAVGIAVVSHAGLGVTCHDFNDDGWIDVYVANDADPNNLWINQQGRRFVDEGVVRGVAYNRTGQTEAGMGVAGGDADGDGDFDLFVTHLIDETNTYYRNFGGGGFEDLTAVVKLAVPSIRFTGFGTAFFDYDNDGDLDLAVTNGAVKRRPQPLGRGDAFWDDYAEPNSLFVNDGNGLFEDAGVRCGDLCADLDVGRGLIPADFDGDGDLDVLVTNLEGPVRLYRNEVPDSGHWLHIRAVDPQVNRDAIHAEVLVQTPSGRQVRAVNPGYGYLCSGDPGVHVGLGRDDRVERIVVRWPDGARESFESAGIDRRITLSKGRGAPVP